MPKLYFPFVLASLLILSVLSAREAAATHVRAGDLTAERVDQSALTYKFTATIYTDDAGVPPDPEIEFDFGTGDASFFPRISFEPVGNNTTKNVYEAVYTFPGPGEYPVGVIIRNRNASILNIPNSVNVAFYIESTFLISPFLGLNSSPVLLVPPIDFAARGEIFIHNPGAYDADGDSLAYIMTVCKKNQGQFVDGYSDPNDPAFGGFAEDGGPATLTLDPITGDLTWNTPGQPGQYNVAFIVQEWRDGFLIGQVNRDMQIIVRDNPNNPPDVNYRDTCVVAGTLVQDTVIATDPDNDFVNLYTYSALYQDAGLLEVPPRNYATFEAFNLQPPNGLEQGLFSWQTTCEDVRREPYGVTFKAEDRPRDARDKLVDLETWRIWVVGPAPDTLIAEVDPGTASVTLNWLSYQCPNASQMTVWRREGSFDFEPDNCETGLPAYTGYRRIGETDIGTTTYTDTGLKRGVTYCYRIFAIFPEPGGGESYASMEVCIVIPINAPYITNVSIEETDGADGEIFVRWIKPIDIDTTAFPRPHTYTLHRAEGYDGTENWRQVGGIFEENDTTFTDTRLNTANLIHNYRVYMYSDGDLVDSSAVASSVRLTVIGSAESMRLNWNFNVPWSNSLARLPIHYIYKRNSSGVFELYDSVNVSQSGFTYLDDREQLNPDSTYCYFVETQGSYDNPNIFEPLFNKSQEDCNAPLDETAPCPPVLSLDTLNCDEVDPSDPFWCENQSFGNDLHWVNNYSEDCDPRITSYNVYFSPTGDNLTLLTSVEDSAYLHEQLNTYVGCYYVTAVDEAGNESGPSNTVCNDNCPFYELPNVITPNDDGKNDTFRPFNCPPFVESVSFTVFNRWGKEVYSSNDDVYINWEAVDNGGNEVPGGLYYYEAKVKFIRLAPTGESMDIKGWINVLK